MKSLSGKEQVELVVLAVKQNGIRCRILETGDPVTLRPSAGVRSEAEAHILTVGISKVWVYGKTTFLSGKVVRMRLDIPALKLVPLKLCGDNLWDPAEEYWGEQDEPMMGCLKPVIAAGPRPSFEMEQILPGMDPNDPDSDPIGRAVDLYEVGDVEGSTRILHQCLENDLCVLDAHAHLGRWAFHAGKRGLMVERAQKNFEAGVAIGDLSLGPGFRGVLRWRQIDNRPFLRCLHGLGLCFWALGDIPKARGVFERMLWLNPSDNQGARFCLGELAAGVKFEDSKT